MSALRFEANADSKPQVHRLAHHRIKVQAHTYRTFVVVDIDADGKVCITVDRDGVMLGVIEVNATEGQRLAVTTSAQAQRIVVNDADRGQATD